MLPEVDASFAVPFEYGLFGAPEGGQQAGIGKLWVNMKIFELSFAEKFPCNPRNLLRLCFHIDAYPVIAADNGGGKIAAMRNGKMVLLTGKERLAGVGNLNQVVGEIRKQELQQKPAGEVLQTLMRVSDVAMLGNIALKKIFRLFYFPYAQPRGFVDLLLKKNRHGTNLRFKIAHLIKYFPRHWRNFAKYKTETAAP